MNSSRKNWMSLVIFALVVLAAAATRLIPHPANVTPVTAMALLAGAKLEDRRWAVGLPLLALFLSDWALGFHQLVPVVYGAFAVMALASHRWLKSRYNGRTTLVASLAGSTFFFVVTNFAVWALGSWYAHTAQGLLACFVAAIPFYGNQLLGDLGYTAVLAGVLSLEGLPKKAAI